MSEVIRGGKVCPRYKSLWSEIAKETLSRPTDTKFLFLLGNRIPVNRKYRLVSRPILLIAYKFRALGECSSSENRSRKLIRGSKERGAAWRSGYEYDDVDSDSSFRFDDDSSIYIPSHPIN